MVFGLQVHGRRVSTGSCRGVLWPMDRAVDGGEGQPGPELGPGGSCGVHSWIEGASGDGRRVSCFAQQNQGGGRWLKTPSRGGTGVGLGTSGGDGFRWRLGSRCGRGGDGRRAASRAVRRPRWNGARATAWRRESSRARSFDGFLKTGHLPGFHGPSKTVDQIFIKMAASWRRLRSEERTSVVRWDRVQGDTADQPV